MHNVLLNTSTDGMHWLAIVVALITVIYISFVRPMRKAKKDPLQRKPGEAMLAQQRAAERDMTALLLEYEQMMRTMTAQIDTRVARLEALLKDADERVRQLQSLGVPSSEVPAPPAKTPANDSTIDLTPLLADSPAPRYDEVYALADQGLSHRQIAQRLDRPYGEIELILALRPKTIPSQPAPEDESPDTDLADSSDSTELGSDRVDTGFEGEPVAMAQAGLMSASSSGGGIQHHRRHRKKRR